MVKSIELCVSNKSIVLNVDKNDWCTVIFHHGKSDVLGADSIDIIINRFLSVLENRVFPKATHQLDGEGYSCFITLFERHASGYARRTTHGLFLHFRNSAGDKIDDLHLSRKDCQRWKEILENMK